MNDMTRGYLECALWTTLLDEDREADSIYDVSDFAPEAVTQASEDCSRFETENAADLADFPDSPDGDSPEAFVGHNLWLTRNGHGTGFWDRDLGEVGDRLSEAARKMGESCVYVGDDERLYIG